MNEKLLNPDYLLHLCQKYSLRPSKKYGQNYLIDAAPIEAMLEAGSVSNTDTIVEVGPGFGILTFALIERANQVLAFEIEKKLEGYWNDEIKNKNIKNLEIAWGNVLKEVDGRLVGGYKVIANLPYQITSQVIRVFLEAQHPPEQMVLMVQKEVAERICARPGDMSVLSLAVQYYAEAEIVMQVPRDLFWPVPGVDSAIIRIQKTKNQKNKKITERFFELAKIGFANRRKLLYKNLLPYAGKKNAEMLKSAFASLGLDPLQTRAQELSVAQWEALTQALENT